MFTLARLLIVPLFTLSAVGVWGVRALGDLLGRPNLVYVTYTGIGTNLAMADLTLRVSSTMTMLSTTP